MFMFRVKVDIRSFAQALSLLQPKVLYVLLR